MTGGAGAVGNVMITNTAPALTETERALVVAAIAAAASLFAVTITAIAAYLATKRDRRRTLYGEAFKVALGWQEMLYRVRRRQPDDGPALLKKFHELQENLTYYQGWIGSESKYMERSYRRLVRAVKQGTEQHIVDAWAAPTRAIPGQALPEDSHPQFDLEADEFLRDVRGHLSLQPWRKLAVVWRNRKAD